MAFTSTSEVNNGYNPDYENVDPGQLGRLGLSSGFQLDAGKKAFGQANRSAPLFTFIGQTTAAESGSFTLNLVTATRSVLDPESSPSNQITKTIGGLGNALVAGTFRTLRLRCKQTVAGAITCFEVMVGVTGAATPVVTAGAASLGFGRKNNAGDDATLTAAAGSVRVTVTSGAATTVAWQVDVFVDDCF